MHLADESRAYKCAILAFGVGNPDMPDKPGDPAGFDGRMLYWQQVLPSLNYAQRNGHILLLHAYGYPDMFHPDADWYIYRYERQVQANLKTLGITDLKYAYGEIGIDCLIVGEKGGYKVNTQDANYVAQLLQWERDLQNQSQLLGGAIFTFGDSGGWGSYDITSTNVASMLAQHYTDHAGDYGPSTATDEQHNVFIPAAGTGQPAAPDLKPVEWDARLTERGVTVQPADVAPGEQFWRVTMARWYNEQESQGRHHIYVDAPDGALFQAIWPTGISTKAANGRSGFDAGNYPMSASLNEFSVRMVPGTPSETVRGIGMGADGNPAVHTSTEVRFELVTMPQAQPPAEQPPTAIEPTPQPDDRWQRSREFVRVWEGGYQDIPNDSGNWTGGKVGVGINKGTKYGISAASYPDLDIKNLTMEQADAIYFRDYWQASGADKLPWPACLLVFDTAVLHGVGTARNWLHDVGPNAFLFAAKRMRVYTRMANWDTWGKGWVNRTADLLERAGG